MEEQEAKARCVQEEMRQALRSAATARAREQSAIETAERCERDLRAQQERLKALRHDSRLKVEQVSCAERRLAVAEATELEREELLQETEQLQQQLQSLRDCCEDLRVGQRNAELAEARASERNGELRGELRAASALGAASQDRCSELQAALTASRQEFADMEGQRGLGLQRLEYLKQQVADAQAGEREAVQAQQRLQQDLQEARRHLERLLGAAGAAALAEKSHRERSPDHEGNRHNHSHSYSGASGGGGLGQLAECRRRLETAEDACNRHKAEVLEERRARDRCHQEAIRAGEKLRQARAQGAQLREKLRLLEEKDLRYPSRSNRRTQSQTAARSGSTGRSAAAVGLRGAASRLQPQMQQQRQRRPVWDEQAAPGAHKDQDMLPLPQASRNQGVDVEDFVAKEEGRLALLSAAAGPATDRRSQSPERTWRVGRSSDVIYGEQTFPQMEEQNVEAACRPRSRSPAAGPSAAISNLPSSPSRHHDHGSDRHGPPLSWRLSWEEEPRAAAPEQCSLSPARPSSRHSASANLRYDAPSVPNLTEPATFNAHCRNTSMPAAFTTTAAADSTAGQSCSHGHGQRNSSTAEISALLAAEPKVLNVSQPLQPRSSSPCRSTSSPRP
eukprot:TRINITY_DN7180_c0_g1_i3.p1 TRINITY_DN7180_c0_g1~~TRINITY_DN7180_c0_g1_i3.p1  ORF type:complete len:620 (+),score=169.83 TRINITY_DN7180_c0_g1_i3:718-2577(+)